MLTYLLCHHPALIAISSGIVIYQVHKGFLNDTYMRLYETIRDYTRLYETIRDYTRLYENIRYYTRLLKTPLGVLTKKCPCLHCLTIGDNSLADHCRSITSISSVGSWTDNPGYLTFRSIHLRRRPPISESESDATGTGAIIGREGTSDLISTIPVHRSDSWTRKSRSLDYR